MGAGRPDPCVLSTDPLSGCKRGTERPSGGGPWLVGRIGRAHGCGVQHRRSSDRPAPAPPPRRLVVLHRWLCDRALHLRRRLHRLLLNPRIVAARDWFDELGAQLAVVSGRLLGIRTGPCRLSGWPPPFASLASPGLDRGGRLGHRSELGHRGSASARFRSGDASVSAAAANRIRTPEWPLRRDDSGRAFGSSPRDWASLRVVAR